MKKYISKRILSFKAAFNGVYIFFKEEEHAKIHLLSAVLALVISYILHISEQDFIIIAILIVMVMVAEMLNSAIEKTVDLAQPNFHPLAGKAKDIAAAAVLLASILAFCVGIYIWSKYL